MLQETFIPLALRAEEKYSDLALDEMHHNWYYFRCFKLMLYDKTVQMSFYFNIFFNLLQEIEFWAFLKILLVYFRLLRPSIGTKERNFDRGRHNGKKWKSWKYFLQQLITWKNAYTQTVKWQLMDMEDSDITWVLTVPAIWTDPSKQFMREAAEKVCWNFCSDIYLSLKRLLVS